VTSELTRTAGVRPRDLHPLRIEGRFRVTQTIEEEVRNLRALYWSDRDPEGRAFATLADALIRAGSLADAEALLLMETARLPDFSTGHVVLARLAVAQRDEARLQEALAGVRACDPENEVVALAAKASPSASRQAPSAAPAEAPAEAPSVPPAPASRDVPADPRGAVLRDPIEEPFALPDDAPPADRSRDSAPFQTRTLGELYARQGLLTEAIRVYDALIARTPEDASLRARHLELQRVQRGETVATPESDAIQTRGSAEEISDPNNEVADLNDDVAYLNDYEGWVRSLSS
jgi:tetratricopeptide (TPR) repeat protein